MIKIRNITKTYSKETVLKIDYLETMLEGPKYNFVYPQDSIVKRKKSV